MSKQINVNPGNYKVAGRERQGEDIVQDAEKRRFARRHAEVERSGSRLRRAAEASTIVERTPTARTNRTTPGNR